MTGPPPVAPLPGDEPAMREWGATALVERTRHDGVELTGDDGLLTELVRLVLQTEIEIEMTDHLVFEAHAAAGRNSGNSRNGSYPKTVTTEVGKVTLDVPRDRNASFEKSCSSLQPRCFRLIVLRGLRPSRSTARHHAGECDRPGFE